MAKPLLKKLRFAKSGHITPAELEIVAKIRPLIEARGVTADDYDLAAAYSQWCQSSYGVTWLPINSFDDNEVDVLLTSLVDPDLSPFLKTR